MFSAIKGVIFDMDGLMLDTEPVYLKSMQQAAAELGISFEEQLYCRFIGRSISDWQTLLIQIFGNDYPQFRKRRRQLWEQHIQEIGVNEKAGLGELLDQLDEDRLLKAIATSSTRADALLCLGELTKRFDVIVTGDQVKYGKPAPDIFLLAAQRLNLSPRYCLVLEDSKSGAEAALAAGMNIILVPDLAQPSDELARQVHSVCASLQEVKQLFRVGRVV